MNNKLTTSMPLPKPFLARVAANDAARRGLMSALTGLLLACVVECFASTSAQA